jgi:hypothetical protein
MPNTSITEMPRGTLADRSGTITSANVSQTVAAAKSSRRYFIFQNVSDTDMWINCTGAATPASGSFLIEANGGWMVFEASMVTTQAWTVICTGSGKAFTSKEG